MTVAFAKANLRSPALWLQGFYRLGLWACVVAFTARAVASAWSFTIDDSGISYAYAKHLAQGLGPVAAPGAPWVEGYSNAAWVFLLVPFHWLGAPLPEVSKWLGVASFAAMGLAGVSLLVRAHGARLGSGALSAVWLLGCGVCLEVVVWVVAGLENALLGALLLGVAALDQRERSQPAALPWSSLLAVAVCITRPEGAMYVAPVVGLRVWDMWRTPGSRRSALRVLAAFALPFALYHLIHFWVFHEWVPNTYYAKPRGRSLSKGLEYLRRGLEDTGLLYVVPLVVVGAVRQWRHKFALAWYCVAGVVFIIYSGGDWMPYGRFLSFFAPPMLLLAAHGIYNLAHWATSLALASRPLARPWAIEGVSALAFVLVVSFWRGYHAPRLAKLERTRFCHFCQRTKDAKKLGETSAAARLGRVTVLTHDFGGPSWLSSETFYPIDFLGLCDASVARIRREQERLGVNTLLSPYLFHEQPHAPSWIYLPKNFWRTLSSLPEFEQGYYALSSRLLPYAPGGSYLALHRGQIVDFFPPLIRTAPERLSPTVGLVGAGWFAAGAKASKLSAGATVQVVVSLLPLGRVARGDKVWVELQGPGQTLRSERISLTRNLDGLERRLGADEPLRFDFSVHVPKTPPWQSWGSEEPAQLRLILETGRRPRERHSVDLARLTRGTDLPVPSRSGPRWPSGLPPAIDGELRDLEPRVLDAVHRQHFGNEWSPLPEDRILASRLHALGDDLVTRDPQQAYLAYVWATRLDARQWESLTEPLLALRKPIDDVNHGTELALLRDYYAELFQQAEPDPASEALTAAERLLLFYRDRGMSRRAEYVRSVAGDRVRAAKMAAAGRPWRELPFDAPADAASKEQPWTGDSAVYFVEVPDDAARDRLRGIDGTSFLSSRRQGPEGKGIYVSPMFVIPGPRLSFSFGGGNKGEVGVELLVEGKVVRSTGRSSPSVLGNVWWDVSEHKGARAQLRVYDRSASSVAYLDRVLLWD